MNVQDRIRGGQVFHDGAVVTAQLAELQNAALASPQFTNGGESTISNVYEVTIQARYNTSTGDDANLSAKAVYGYHLESTAGALSGGVTGSSAGANGLVMPDSTTVFNRGKIVTNDSGVAVLRLTSTGTSTARLFIHLPSGVVVAGSTVVFT